MRAGIVGKGFIARGPRDCAALARRRSRMGGARRRERRRPPYGVSTLLDRAVDVLHVCTPNDVHARQALAAIERGVHVVCEKPLAVSSEECAELVAAAEQRASCTRSATTSAATRSSSRCAPRSRAGALGELTFVHGRYLCDDVLFPASGWRIDPARRAHRYVVGDLGTHWLDLAEHVTGQHVTEVLADFRSFAGGPARGLRRAAAALRGWGGRHPRALGRRRGPEEPAPVRARRLPRRLDVGPGGTQDAPRPPRDGAEPDRGRRIRQRIPQRPSACRAIPRVTGGIRAGVPERVRERLPAIRGEPHDAFRRSHEGARGVATWRPRSGALAEGRWVARRGVERRQARRRVRRSASAAPRSAV